MLILRYPFPQQMCFCCVLHYFLTYLTSSGMLMVWSPTNGAGSDLEEFENGHFTELKFILHFVKVGEVPKDMLNHLQFKKWSYFLRIFFSSII